MNTKMVDYISLDSPYRSDEQHGDGYSPNIATTLRSLKEEIKSCKPNNDKVIHSQERLSRSHEK